VRVHVERTFTVAKPIEAVFDYLSDFTRTEQWDPGTVSTTRISGDGGVGTRYANVSEFVGRRVELVYETIVLDRPGEVRFRGTSPTATTQDRMVLRTVGDGATEVHYRADFHFKGVVRLAAPFVVKPKLSPLADETVEKLSAALVAHA
jgi:carbon monoxide dehydrogenase subunit G